MDSLVKNLGVAKNIGNFANGSVEWHELRLGGVGGSQIGTIMGVNKWESAYTAWAKATGQIDDKLEPSLPMRVGTFLEPFIRDEYKKANPLHEVWETGTWERNDLPWAHANPDGFIKYPDGELGILEIKYSRLPFYDGLPLAYRYQVLWYMFVTGVRRGVVAAFAGGDYKEFEVEYDEFLLSAIVDQVQQWWYCVKEGVAPAWDGSESTYDTVRMLSTVGEESVELDWAWVNLSNAQDAYDKAEAELNLAKSSIIAQMSGAKTGLYLGEPVLTLSMRKNGPIIQYKKGAVNG